MHPRHSDALRRPFACLGPTTKDGVQYSIHEREESAIERAQSPGWKRSTREEVNAAHVANKQAPPLATLRGDSADEEVIQ